MDSPRKRRTENADSTPRTSKRRRLDETHTSTDLNDSYPTPSTPSTHKHHADFNGDEGPSNAGKPWKAKEKYISNHEDSLIFPEERLDAHHRSKHKSTVPIRRLTEFTFYSSSTRRRIRLDHVLEENETSTNPNLMSAYFNGMVSPMNGKQDGSSSISISKPSPIVSSEIRHVWQSDEYKDKKALDDMKIWVQTDFAWYILEHPSKDYIDWYIDCWLQHQIWLAISYTSKMAVASIQKFKAVLNRSVIACAERDFQRKVTMRKIETFIPSILQTITEAAQESYEGSIKLAETGFFRLLCAEYAPHLLDFIAEDDNSSDIQPPSPLLSRPPSSPHPQPKPPVEFESGFGEEPQPRSRSSSVSTQSSCDISRTSDSSTTNQEYPTFCTPLVRRLSQPYLPLLGLQEKGADDSWEDEHVTRGALSMDMSQREYVDIGLPKFTPPVSWDREGIAESTCLRWVDVDAQRFQPNDTVYVYFDNQRGQVLHIPPADLPKHIYIALILYLYLDKFERPKAHVIYFEPASNTSLGNLEEKENDLMVSLAHPQELILSNDCAEVHVTQFFGLCDNTYLVPGSPEPSPRKDSISYFYRYFWIAKDDDAFIDAKLFLNQSRDMVQTKSCPCCGNKDPRHCTKITPDGVVVGNTEYHINDFAYIQHEQSDKPYIIGQMLRFYTTPSKTIKIQYRRYYRPKLTPEQSHNDRLLTFDDSGTQYSIDANRLEGKCFVIPLAEDSQDNCLLPDDCFVCDFPPFVRLCRQCGFPDLPQKTQPLRGLDLFSGAGGLSIGLESTGVVETGWAVERDESAAKTFQKNHKDARVYNMCINRLLSEVYAREHQSEQLDDSDLIDFPRRGEVDIVFGGPPCQGFTVLNRQRRATDRRNQLILSFMSAVDILRPKYVLIENVKEMLSFPIGGISGGGMTFDGGIKRGFVKLVKRLLTGMDYQVRYGILHSGQYGVPQPRRRVFFLAAQRGLMLPDLPQPTHVAFLPLNLKVIVNEKHNEAEELSFTVSKRKNNNAPLGIVTVSDAISDLHRWEWRRPNLSELPEEEQIMHAERIVKKNIQVVDHTTQPFDVNLHVSGPEDPVPYRGGPMSNYQRMLRENRKFVTQHWSPTFHEEEIVRICSVPFKSQRDPKHVPGHNDLPPEQQRPSLHGKKRYDGEFILFLCNCKIIVATGRYGRLDNGDYFDVSIGRLGPNIDVGRVIHPDFHRILTIREAARSQGFPDRVEFECVGNSVSRITQQIGNSVPPPIAAAIGREIQKAWLEDMEEHNREGSRGSISWHEGKYYLNSAELERFVTPEPPECCRFEIHSMPPKAKGKKGKKQDDDDFWSNAGESLSTTDPVKTGAHVGADEDDAGPSNRHGFAGLDIGAGEQDEEDPDSFMAMLQKRKDKKKTKKGTNDENDEKGLDESTAAVELKPAKEMTAEDLADEEFGPIKEKGKKKKGKDKKTVSKPAPDEEGDQENAQTAAPTDAPGDDASGDEGDGGPKLLSKKEKEKLKKEKERAKKKAQAAAKKTQTGGEEGEDGDAKAAAPPPPTDPNASETKEKEDDEDGGEADAAAKKKKKKKKAKKEDDDEAPAPASAPVATTSKKKAPAGIAALKAALEQKRLAEEEAKRKLEEERRRIEEEERLAAEAERKKEEERQRKKDKEKAKKELARKEGRLLTDKQRKEKQLAEIRRQALIQAGAVVEGLAKKDGEPSGAPKKVVYGKRQKGPGAHAATASVASSSNQSTPRPPSPMKLPPEPLVEQNPAPQSEEKDWDASSGEEGRTGGGDGLKDDWDASSDEEKPTANKSAPQPAPLKGGPTKASEPANTQGSKDKGKSLPDAKSGPAQATKKPVPTAGKPASKAQPPPESSSEGESDSESESESESDDSDDSDEESSSDDGLTTAKRMEAERKAAAATRRRQREEEAKAAASKDNLRSPICCILGHVDTGKTKLLDKIRQTNVQEGEAGGITQQIGATYFPVDAIRTKTAVVNKNGSFEFKIPGLLIIDTPGHESFTNLRSRGSSLCNIAILVVDIMHGLEPQTIESLNLLRNGSTPFIIALNKIDRIYGWNATPDNGAQDSLSKQTTAAQREFADRAQKAIIQIAEQGLNSELYWKNTDPRRVVNIVPTSAITGEGVPDMIKLLVELTQTRMVNSLMYISTLECTVLEVKVVEGLGTTIDVILSNGYLREGDKIVICGLSGPIVTQVRALLMPQPLRELRIKSAYVHNKEVKAANGVKIVAPDLDKAIAGSKLLVCGPDDDEDDLIEEVMKPLEDLLKRISKTQVGVHVQASTLGSLEALLSFLETSKIPVSGIQIGPVHQKDVKRAMTQLEKAQEMAVILCFDVPVDKEAEKLAEESGVKLFRADILYHLFDKFTAYHKEITEAKRKDAAPQAVWPCRLKVIAVFAKRDPIIVGVDILEGTLRVGTPLCVVNAEKQIIKLGRITSLEINHKTMDIVKKSQAGGGVAVKIEHAVYETPKMVGRHFTEADEVLSLISRQSIDVLKETFRNDVTKEEWLLIKNLKARLQIP